MKDLVASMAQDDPATGPLIKDVMQEFLLPSMFKKEEVTHWSTISAQFQALWDSSAGMAIRLVHCVALPRDSFVICRALVVMRFYHGILLSQTRLVALVAHPRHK